MHRAFQPERQVLAAERGRIHGQRLFGRDSRLVEGEFVAEAVVDAAPDAPHGADEQTAERVDLNLLGGGGLAAQRLRAPSAPAVRKTTDAARRRMTGATTCVVCPHIMRSEPFPCHVTGTAENRT